ncbi:MAG TPA: hypothetical protein H9919_06950 [Candidatus Alistipes excrementipullorum]|nr:hypothetical protein [Candidatus Alistipes excrementipullorum]
MQKCQLNPTPNQTFEIVGTGEYDFSNVLRHSYELQERDKNIEEACNERFHAFQRIVELIPENEEINLEWEHANTRAALETVYASAVDHFLIDDFEMAAGMLEMLLDLDPEDHTECVALLAFCYVAMEEYELFDEIVNDISDKLPEKHLLLMWASFRQTGRIPEGELRVMNLRHRLYLEEFRAAEHPVDEEYVAGLDSNPPLHTALARQLWLQTENLWTLHPDFIEALREA